MSQFKKGDILMTETNEFLFIGTLCNINQITEENVLKYLPYFFTAVKIRKPITYSDEKLDAEILHNVAGVKSNDESTPEYQIANDTLKFIYRNILNDAKPKKPEPAVAPKLKAKQKYEIINKNGRIEADAPSKPNTLIDFRFNSKRQKIFFTSDLHLSHENVIRFNNRPFTDVNDMDETIINNWNKKVGQYDIVFILGDFCFGGSTKWLSYLDRLNGIKYLIIGNHDEKNLRQSYIGRFAHVAYMMHIYIDDKSFYLSHFPLLCYAGSYRQKHCVYALHGHVHSKKGYMAGADINRLAMLFPSQYDVGVDNNNYEPISYEELMEKIAKQRASWKWKLKDWIMYKFTKLIIKIFDR